MTKTEILDILSDSLDDKTFKLIQNNTPDHIIEPIAKSIDNLYQWIYDLEFTNKTIEATK